MSPLGGAVTMDVDGKGKIWASTPDGAVRFDPVAEKFTEFKSISPTNPKGTGSTYGAAGDRDGNGWWAQMAIDTIGKADVATGKATEIKLPALKDEIGPPAGRTRASTKPSTTSASTLRCRGRKARAAWAPTRTPTCCGSAIPGARRLARIDTKTLETTIIPFPDTTMQPYHIAVDSKHNVWGNLWTSDRIVKLRSGREHVDDVRPAGARHGNPPHLAARA